MKANLNVIGMHCASCASIIEKKSKKLPGIKDVVVNVASNTASIEYDESVFDFEKLNKELGKYGYNLETPPQSPNGGAIVSNALTHRIGISALQKPSPNLSDLTSPVGGEGERKNFPLDKGGWGDFKLEDSASNIELRKLKKSTFFLLPVALFFFLMMIHHSLVKLGYLEMWAWEKYLPQIGFILSSIVFFGFGQKFMKAFFRFCRYGVANMDTLVGLGAGVAYLYSAVMFLFPNLLEKLTLGEDMYFEAVIIIIGFITFGDYLVESSKSKTGEALKKLLNLQAKFAIVLKNGKEIKTPIEDLKVGDIFLVKPGEKVAVDGEIISGETAIDESMISGEALPVHKKVGDTIIGATINKHGSLQVKATKVGTDTMLSQIIKAVGDAQNSKAPIQSLADKIVSVFVPVVLVIAFSSLIIWTILGELNVGFVSFIAILVVACPCAMGLATPMAVTIGVGKSALNGILVKNAESLQKLSKVDFVVFDKTGTITEGKMKVVEENLKKDEWNILYSLEKKSNHPLAEAIIKKAESLNIPLIKGTKGILKHKTETLEVKKFKNVEGMGVEGEIDGIKYWAGNKKLMNLILNPSPLTGEGLEIAKGERQEVRLGQTPVFFGRGEELLGTIWIADVIKSSAKSLIEELHKSGIKTAILTGDRKESALPIAKEAGIDEIIAEVLPSEKAKKIKELQEKGFKVAMVGDGINDAVALSQADVGIAMGTGTDIAIESADITLLGGKIEHLITSISISKATMRTIKQNLFFSFFYNSVAIPIAAGILYPFWGILLNPAIEGAAMVFSSVSVVFNSLRLRR